METRRDVDSRGTTEVDPLKIISAIAFDANDSNKDATLTAIKSTSSANRSLQKPVLIPVRGIKEIYTWQFYRQLVTEIFGSFILVSMGCLVITPIQAHGTGDASLSMASIILSWGFTVATVVWTIAHVSGCFLNPAVTMSMWVNGRVSFVRCASYIVMQLIGCIAGSAFHTYVRGPTIKTTCQTLLNRAVGVDEFKGLVVEFYISFILLFFVFATTDHSRQDHGGSHALMVGGVIIPLVNAAAELTGAAMNPARAFGPAVIHGNWEAHWVYWVGDITGAVCGGLVYDLVFTEKYIAWTKNAYVVVAE